MTFITFFLNPLLAGEKYIFNSGTNNKYSLTVPAGWKIDDSGKTGAAILLIGPNDNSFNSQIIVIISNAKNMTLEQCLKELYETFKHPPSMYKEIKVISEIKVDIGGIKGYQLVVDYIMNKQGKNLSSRTLQTIILKNNCAFIITGVALKSNFSKYEKTFKIVTKSFKFEK